MITIHPFRIIPSADIDDCCEQKRSPNSARECRIDERIPEIWEGESIQNQPNIAKQVHKLLSSRHQWNQRHQRTAKHAEQTK
jgi:hypothetical protein